MTERTTPSPVWEIKKVNLFDYQRHPYEPHPKPFYLWCLFDPSGRLRGQSEGFAIHDNTGRIVQGSDSDAVNSLKVSVPEGETCRIYGPFESMKGGHWSRSAPIDENGGHTMMYVHEAVEESTSTSEGRPAE